MNNERGGGGNFWLGFFLGGLVGAFIIFVMGTKEGKKIADEILEKGEEYEEDLEQKVAKLHKKGEELLHETESIKERVVKHVEEGKKAVSDSVVIKMDEALSKIEDIGRKGVALTEDLHHHYFKKNGKSLTS